MPQVLQSVTGTTKRDRLLLQSSSGITKCDRLLLQSASDITKCDRMLIQSASGITKCDSYYKVRRNNCVALSDFSDSSISFIIPAVLWRHKQTSKNQKIKLLNKIGLNYTVCKVFRNYKIKNMFKIWSSISR